MPVRRKGDQMKLSELKPCFKCGGTVNPFFYQVDLTHIMIDAGKANQALGFAQSMQSLRLAEVMGPFDDVTKEIASHKFVLCQACCIEALGECIEKQCAKEVSDEDR